MIEMIEAGFRSPCLYTLFGIVKFILNILVLVSSFSYYFKLCNRKFFNKKCSAVSRDPFHGFKFAKLSVDLCKNCSAYSWISTVISIVRYLLLKLWCTGSIALDPAYMYVLKTSIRHPFAWMSLCHELEPDIYIHCIQWPARQRNLVILPWKGHILLKSKGFYACGFLCKNSNYFDYGVNQSLDW